jgi:peptide/nickel transport system substrate-binding protein
MTVFTQWGYEDPSGFNTMTQRVWSASVWVNPFTEWLCRGDIEKFGPEGNNAFSFQTWENVPEQYLTGELAQSWEIQTSPLQMTFHIRQGVMWTANSKINFAARELTASDIVFAMKNTIATPGPGSYLAMISDITAPDKYTAVFTLKNYDANWFFIFGGGMAMGGIQPKEMVDANNVALDPLNSVGTGPFILTAYQSGVGATYQKNPNYWGTTTIGGQTYKMPFIDTLYYPIITDESAQVAALRTAKIDWWPNVKIQYQSSLASSAPSLIVNKYLFGKVDVMRLNRIKSTTMSSKNVRQALMIGLDLNQLSTLLYSGGPIVSWPIGPQAPGFTKLTDLPAADQALYSYNVTTAKKMLSDAGYPNGFSVVITVDTNSAHLDLANALVSQWAKIGVTATIQSLDATPFASARDNVTYPDMIYTNYTVVNPLTTLHMVASDVLATNYAPGGPLEAMYKTASQDMDPVQRTKDEQALAVAFLDDVNCIPFAQPYNLNCIWPWLMNYQGEIDTGYYNQIPMIKRMWIDPAKKSAAGF